MICHQLIKDTVGRNTHRKLEAKDEEQRRKTQ